MKKHTLQSCFASVGRGVLLCTIFLSLSRAEIPPPAGQTGTKPAARPSGPPKVRVLVKENMGSSSAGGAPPAGTPAPKKAAGQATPPAGAGQQAANAANAALDAEKYTRTMKKTLTVDVVNLTTASMDVTVKTNFLARDEGGKHEVLTEKTVETPLTVLPGKSGSFTTEEVSFTHTTAHRGPVAKGGGGGGGGGGGKGIAPMIPSSGHAYYGYKVEVFQGNDLVGTTASEIH